MMRPAPLLGLSPLLLSIVVGILCGVVEFGLYIGLPIHILVSLYIFWILSNYFVEVVEHKALGNEDWPVFSLDTLVAGRSQVGLVFSLFVVAFGGVYLLLRYLGENDFALWWLSAGLALLPASAALVAVTRELAVAFNPLRLLAAAFGMGYRYVCCLLATVAIVVLIGIAQSRGGFWYFVFPYALFLQAYLIGSSVYARRIVLGVTTLRSPEARAERAHAEIVAVRRGILSHAYGFAARDNKAGALRHIEGYLASDEDSLEARLWFLNELTRWEDRAVARRFGEIVIAYCEQHGLDDEVARLRLKYGEPGESGTPSAGDPC